MTGLIDEWPKKARHTASQIIFDFEHSSSDFSDGGLSEEISKAERKAKFLPMAILDFIHERKEKEDRLHADIRKYREALNRIAWPEHWDGTPAEPLAIARKALVI